MEVLDASGIAAQAALERNYSLNCSSMRYCHCVEKNAEYRYCDCPYKIDDMSIERSYAWRWSEEEKTNSVRLAGNRTRTKMHGYFSSGNAAVRGDTPFVNNNHYFWEIRIMRELQGSSTMIGVATAHVSMTKYSREFTHFLGNDDQSWGLTSQCMLRHNKESRIYDNRSSFSAGTLVGVHLDMWEGTLEYFINRRPFGIAFRGLRDRVLYPVLSTTSALSLMELCHTTITPHSLLFLSLRKMNYATFRTLPYHIQVKLPECWWLLPQRELYSYPSPRPTHTQGIQLRIDSDSDDDELHRHLRARMRRVVENAPISPPIQMKKRRKTKKRKNKKK